MRIDKTTLTDVDDRGGHSRLGPAYLRFSISYCFTCRTSLVVLDVLKPTLKRCDIDPNTWESEALSRTKWRSPTQNGTTSFEGKMLKRSQNREARQIGAIDNL